MQYRRAERMQGTRTHPVDRRPPYHDGFPTAALEVASSRANVAAHGSSGHSFSQPT